MAGYIASFANFFGNREGAIKYGRCRTIRRSPSHREGPNPKAQAK